MKANIISVYVSDKWGRRFAIKMFFKIMIERLNEKVWQIRKFSGCEAELEVENR